MWSTADWTPANPDLAGINSLDPSAAAAVVTVKSLAPVDEIMMLQLNFAGDQGGVDFSHVVALGDTVISVAQALAAQIVGNALCAAHHIGAQYTPQTSTMGVTNWLDNLVTVTIPHHAECFAIQPSAPQLDAGPIIFLNRVPVDGAVPPNGSNIGQITYGSRLHPGDTPNVEYAVIGCNIRNNDPANLDGELAFYTVETRNGAPYPAKRLAVSRRGLTLGDDDELQFVWQSYAPVVAAYQGTVKLGDVQGRYMRVGGTCFLRLVIPILDGGSGKVFLTASLPIRTTAGGVFFGRAKQTSGRLLQGWVGSPELLCIEDQANQYPGPPPGGAETIELGGFYEVA